MHSLKLSLVPAATLLRPAEQGLSMRPTQPWKTMPQLVGPIQTLESTGIFHVHAGNYRDHRAELRCDLIQPHSEDTVRAFAYQFFSLYVQREEKWEAIIDISKRYIPCTGNETECEEQYVFAVHPFGVSPDQLPMGQDDLARQADIGRALLVELVREVMAASAN